MLLLNYAWVKNIISGLSGYQKKSSKEILEMHIWVLNIYIQYQEGF